MKKFLLLISFAFQFTVSHAQSWVYHPFPADSAAWMHHHSSWAMSNHNYRTYMLGDTVISGINYKKIYQTLTFWIDGPVPIQESDYYGAMREDVTARKVYFFGKNDVSESVFHDFNLQIGDIVTIDSATVGNLDTIYVSAIDSVMVDVNYNKRFVLSSTQDYPVGGLVEGVGNLAGFGRFYLFTGNRAEDLICLSVRNHVIYNYYGSGSTLATGDCAYAVGIAEFKNNKIGIEFGPNPSHGTLNLTISCKDSYSYEIMNGLGEMLMKKSGLNQPNTSVDLSSFANGIYFIRLSDLKGNSVTKKIVKE